MNSSAPKGMRIGEFLVSKKILTPRQVELILEYSREKGLRFGEAGMELGFLSRESFIQLFSPASNVDLFQVHPQYFPVATKEILKVDTLLKYGVLPLGVKSRWSWGGPKKCLNLGFLSPRKKHLIEVVKEEILKSPSRGEITDFKIFVIIADQFIHVMERIYQITPEQIRAMKTTELDPTLRMFLEDTRDLESLIQP